MATREELLLFADVFEYPTAALWDQLRRATTVQASALGDFAAFLARERVVSAQEVYTNTFDLDPVCCPYVAFHLFGESFKRGALMAKLRETYAEHGFAASATELPDHLSTMLRFAAACEDSELAQEMLNELVLPALRTMTAGFTNESNPYREGLRALMAALDQQPAANLAGGVHDV